MPRLGRKLEVEITERGTGDGHELMNEGEAIRRLSASGCFQLAEALKLLVGSADSGTAVVTNYATYRARWVGEKRTLPLRVVGALEES